MSEPERCASCGLPLNPPGPGGLCPICLLEIGMQAADEPHTEGAPPSGAPAAASPGVIGPYHLLQALGEGGMGLVYLAEQREPLQRRVALKLIKPGMATREVLARFEAERQALALMDHPNIARVLDAGIGPGERPYFVMEYVAGVPITDYCDRLRLRVAERLQIFVQVCAALQHAHQKGIIHRDLKPSNILVTVQDGKPVPKVIDFGIAKATRQGSVAHAAFTRFGMLIGTPEYISPEQAEASGLEVDTTTDIYSLGVVLYELLTGVLPFDGETLRQAGYAEMHRIIREQDPPKPSQRVTTLGATAEEVARQHQTTQAALGKQLRGDLDAIAMKAMEKDRTRRYASASEFAADITRYLNGEAVVASPPSVVYRTRKFVRRHRLGVAAALAVVLALAAGVAVSTGLYLRAEDARRETDRQRVAADRRGYVANIAAAKAAIDSNQVREARYRLRACPAGFRDWEWQHLWSRTDSSLATIGSGGGAPLSVSVTPDGTRVLWVTENGVVHAADLSARLPIPEFRYPQPGASEPQSTIAMSTDGTRALVVGRALPSLGAMMSGKELPLRLPDRPSPGEAVLTLTVAASSLTSVEWAVESLSPDTLPSDVLAAGGDTRTLTVFDMGQRKPSASIVLPSLGVSAPIVVRMPSDRDVAEHGLVTIAFEENVVSDSFGRKHATMSGRMSSTVSAVFSRDGRRIATWTWDHVIRVWNAESGKAEAVLAGHRDGITQAVFSPDGSLVASASHDGTVRLWPIAPPAAALVLTGHQGAVLALAFDTRADASFPAGRTTSRESGISAARNSPAWPATGTA
jgi:serine/threonine protein kinase